VRGSWAIGLKRTNRSASTIDVGAVLDPNYMDNPGLIVNPVDDPVGAATR
jgi:hypothetical protein